MSISSRPYHHGALRGALLQTTRTLLDEVGVEGLSLREVSRRTGVSHAAAYNHFRDKAALMRGVVEAAFERLAADLRRARDSAGDPLEALRRIGVAYVVFAYRNPAEFKVMFRPELCDYEPGRRRENDAAYRVLVETVEECLRTGAIAPGDTETIVIACWSLAHGLASLLVDGPDPKLVGSRASAEALARGCIDAMTQGLRAG